MTTDVTGHPTAYFKKYDKFSLADRNMKVLVWNHLVQITEGCKPLSVSFRLPQLALARAIHRERYGKYIHRK